MSTENTITTAAADVAAAPNATLDELVGTTHETGTDFHTIDLFAGIGGIRREIGRAHV